MRIFFIKAIEFYQRYLSVLSFGSCRYYPTCSAYAKLQFQHNFILFGIWASLLRILRCNQLFNGGIDHPRIKKNFQTYSCIYKNMPSKIDIKYWFIPNNGQDYFVIKQIDF